jgi:hypothetical protein
MTVPKAFALNSCFINRKQLHPSCYEPLCCIFPVGSANNRLIPTSDKKTPRQKSNAFRPKCVPQGTAIDKLEKRRNLKLRSLDGNVDDGVVEPVPLRRIQLPSRAVGRLHPQLAFAYKRLSVQAWRAAWNDAQLKNNQDRHGESAIYICTFQMVCIPGKFNSYTSIAFYHLVGLFFGFRSTIQLPTAF